MKRLSAAISLMIALGGHAEQFEAFGEWQVHYVAFNASFLRPEIANQYGLVRGHNKALVNVSAIGPDGRPRTVEISGAFLNLLGQKTPLHFAVIEEADAVYYLAPFDIEDGERLRFKLHLELPGHGAAELDFEQSLYWAN